MTIYHEAGASQFCMILSLFSGLLPLAAGQDTCSCIADTKCCYVAGAPRGAGGGQPILPGDVHLRLQGELPPSRRGPAAGGLGLADTGHVTTVLTPGWSQDIVLPGLAAEALGLVLEFVYTGKLALSPRNIQEVLACASQLQVCCRTSASWQTLSVSKGLVNNMSPTFSTKLLLELLLRLNEA